MKILESTRESINNYLNNRRSGERKLAELKKLAEKKILSTYIICANYRSGSTLLSLGLRDSGVAGDPKEYFNIIDHEKRLSNFPFFKKSLRILYKKRRSKNRIFGFKIMWSDFVWIFDRFGIMGIDTKDKQLVLETIFPNLKYIYIYRQDKLRQAISMVRSVQSKYWHKMRGDNLSPDNTKIEYIGEKITTDLLNGVILNELKWQNYFSDKGIYPLIICYENFANDYSGTLRKTLDYLDVPGKENAIIDFPPLERVADDITDQWVERYLNENPWLADEYVRDQLYNHNNFGLAMESFQKYNKDRNLEELSKWIRELIEKQSS